MKTSLHAAMRSARRTALAGALAATLAGLCGHAMADDFLALAKQKVAAATAPKNKWDGPTTGPRAAADKTLVFVASDMRNGGVLGVSKGAEEAAQAIGWKVRVLDGQGTVQGRTSAFNQAMALKPAGILLGGFDAKEQATNVKKAGESKIPVVGWHAAKEAGAVDGMFFNVTTNAQDVAEIAALYAVAKSEGKAGVVVFTDSAYAVAIAKSNAMADVIKKCAGCTLLGVEDTPLADTSTRMPQLTTSLIQRHGAKWSYSLGINDLYFDFMGPTLQSAGGSAKALQNLSGGDGSESAYQRIRNQRFQAGTVPEPLNLHGWQMVDEVNRALGGQPPSGYSTPVHLVTADNIKSDGGPKNSFDPDNGYRDAYRKIWGK
ncbi:substrate-binding domain-containing protein [Variovorax guangxiensis]|uniref:substrate-binding domain-containing protein n=1 Tax=Variovorax guangxiensis TaxID=1775474 RepID=UPI0028641EDD|nr:substrate-binding domain-containing protein [Variovorax guangxiensis]MDR6860117.1 ribose transport system substrate-binding protein [Variovorax guangxiensis]